MNEQQLAAQVNLAGAGDLDALQRLIVHYHAELRGVVAAATDGALRRHVEPDDVLQQAYISAFKVLADPNRDRQRAEVRAAKRERAERSGPRPRAADRSRDRQRADVSAHHFDCPEHFHNWLRRIALDRLKDAQRALRRQKRNAARELHDRRDPTASYPDLVHRLAGDESTPSRQIAKHEATAAVMSCLARLSDDQREVVRLRFLEDVPVAEIARRLGKTDTAVYTLCHRGLKSLRELMVSITRYLSRL